MQNVVATVRKGLSQTVDILRWINRVNAERGCYRPQEPVSESRDPEQKKVSI